MPDNGRAWMAWALVQDQWRVGMEVTGFDLPGATIYLDRLGLADPETLIKLRTISNVALAELRERRADKAKAKTR
jgi:hypothetical protein